MERSRLFLETTQKGMAALCNIVEGCEEKIAKIDNMTVNEYFSFGVLGVGWLSAGCTSIILIGSIQLT